MANEHGLRQRWEAARPSKTALFWSCAGCAALTMVVGFTWGGWVMGGSAEKMAAGAARGARAELAAAICVDHFLGASDAGLQLASLKDSSAWKREAFIEEGGWVTLAGLDEPVAGAAELCADQLVAIKLPPAQDAAAADGTVTTVQ